MFRKTFLIFNIVFILLIAQSTLGETTPSRPNIIFIVADDLGYGDLGCYGQKVIQTPHIDQLAADGMRFTDHYAGATVCRPSRLVFLTGYHGGHTAIATNAKYDLQPGDITVAEMLQKAGYVTGGVGKWALGGVGSTGHPNQQGFDFWYGYLDQSEAHNYYPEVLYRNDEAEPQPGNKVGKQNRVSVQRETYSHDQCTKEALAFIRRSKEKPFFLNIAWTIPHANNERGRAMGDGMEVPDYGDYADKDWPQPEKGFAAMISRMDADVGRIVALLKELEIENDTLILFTSDNGPHEEGGHKHEFFNSNGDLRGYKRDLYEGGIRVPLIAKWPGKIKAGVATNHPSAFCDLLPTCCELAGVEPPAGDGVSYLPELLGEEQVKHRFLFWKEKQKLALRQFKWKAVRPGLDQPVELYDLRRDISEQENMAEQFPKRVANMTRLMERAQVRDVALHIEAKGWGDAPLSNVAKVLRETTLPLMKQFPGKSLAPIQVKSKGGPIVLFERTEAGEYQVRLDTESTYWAQYVYQFSHEMCHILCNYEEDRNGNLWFEESLCEMASIYTLRRLGEKWKTDPPYENWKSFAPHLTQYADELIEQGDLPEGLTLADWYASHAGELRETGTNRQLNNVAAVELLPLFEADPTNWRAIEHLNDGEATGAISFADYLAGWRDRCPASKKGLVNKIAKQLGVELEGESCE